MNYTCLLWSDTGFNTVNIPDSPELIMSLPYLSLPVLDLVQERFLPNIKVRATWDQVKNADICKVGDWFYFVSGVHMTSNDVCSIDLIPDFLTSAGGVANLDILDGVTDRVHVTSDGYGLYTEDDPYMNPAYDMDILSHTHTMGSTSYTFVETTLNLKVLGMQKQGNSTEALVAACEKDGEEFTVTYPVVPMLNGTTTYSAGVGTQMHGLTDVKGQGLYWLGGEGDVASNFCRDGISQARCLGIEEAISGQFSIPAVFVDPLGAGTGEFVEEMRGGAASWQTSEVPFIYGSARNRRIFYGSQTPYILAAASGDTLTARAEEIYGSGMTGPAVSMIADPRRSGKPYYRFTVLNGKSAAVDFYDFFRNCVAGQPWQSAPMVFNDKSGSILDQVNHAASMSARRLKELEAENQFNKQTGLGAQIKRYAPIAAGLVGSAAVALLSGGASIGPEVAMIAGGAGALGGVASNLIDDANIRSDYERYLSAQAFDRAIEEQQFAISQAVYTPTVAFPADPALFSEITHNGYAVYRAVYSNRDISRIDKILTAYGYKHTKMLEKTDFTNRRYFNYVKSSVSVARLPRWWATGVAAQLSGGVRVWHVQPDPQYYTNNPVA